MPKGTLRVIDANLNRAREGLRVCEEVARFCLEDAGLTRQCQRLRHELSRLALRIPSSGLLEVRDSSQDVGHPSRRGAVSRHRAVQDVILANARRVEESLRVLEEFTRLTSVSRAQDFGKLRFKVYHLEQLLLSKGSALRHC